MKRLRRLFRTRAQRDREWLDRYREAVGHADAWLTITETALRGSGVEIDEQYCDGAAEYQKRIRDYLAGGVR